MRNRIALAEYDDETRRLIEVMQAAEQRALAARRHQASHDPDLESALGEHSGSTRRRFLFGAAALAGTGAMLPRLTSAAPPGAIALPVPEDPIKVQGRLTNDDGGYGTRSQFEDEVRGRVLTATKGSSWSMTPLADGMGIITPSGLHFERHHGGIPNIDPAKHSLTIHGMVNQAKHYTMDDIKRFPSVSRIHFIECSSNGFTEWREPTLKTVQGTHGLTSTSEWTGVPLSTLLREVGVRAGAAWVFAEGADGAVMTRTIPLAKCWGDALVAYGQNGAALRPAQGYPLRLVLPGFGGNTHIKWLRRLAVSDKPLLSREETSEYTDLRDNGKARQFSFTIEAKSVITFPSGGMKLPGAGSCEVTGLAWSGRGRIKRVEVSTDGGQNWYPAGLQDPILPVCHTRFRFPWFWDGQPAILQSRCQDETGYVQPTIKQLVDVRGLSGGKLGSIYHLNGIQSWQVAADGSVSNVHHYA